MAALFTLMVLIYALMAHWSIHQGKAEYAVYLLGLLCILFTLSTIYRNQRISSGNGMALLLGAGLLWFPQGYGINLMQLIPVAINGLLFALFATSLRSDHTPMITRLASLIRGGNMPAPVVIYTRRVTVVWTLFFLVLGVTGLLLAIFASLETWSIFANLYSYLLIAALFVLEFLFRRWHLGELADDSFVDFIKSLFRLDYRRIFRSR